MQQDWKYLFKPSMNFLIQANIKRDTLPWVHPEEVDQVQ